MRPGLALGLRRLGVAVWATLGYFGGMSKKPPLGTPEVGDRVFLRGSPLKTGTLKSFNPANEWSRVEWDHGVQAPLLCHRFELARLVEAATPTA